MEAEVGTKLLYSCCIKESVSKEEESCRPESGSVPATLLLALISLEVLSSVHSFSAPFQT